MEKKLIKMHLGVRIATIFTCLLFSVGNIFAQTDPCSQKTKLSGGTTINNQNKTGQVVSITEGETLINISLPAGTYIVKIATEEGNTYVKRLCVQ